MSIVISPSLLTSGRTAIIRFSIFSFLLLVFLGHSLLAQDLALDWSRRIGGTGLDVGNSIEVDANGNVYTVGRFDGTVDFDEVSGPVTISSGGADIYVVKYDSTGTLLWARAMGGTSLDAGIDIAIDGAGNVYTTGWFNGTADFDPGAGVFTLTATVGGGDVFISKLDASGNFVWAKSLVSTGGSSDLGEGIAVDGAGNVYCTGRFDGTVDFDPGIGNNDVASNTLAMDVFILKLNNLGNFVWVKTIGGNSVTTVASDIALDATGNIHVIGSLTGGSIDADPGAGTVTVTDLGGNGDIFILKLDTNGDFVWVRDMGGSGYDNVYDIVVDDAGNIFSVGFLASATCDFDRFAGPVIITRNGSASDGFVTQHDASGNLVWVKALQGTNETVVYGVALDAQEDLFITGYFDGTTDFDPNAGFTNLASNSSQDIFIAKILANGNFAQAVNMGGSSADRGESIAVITSGTAYVTGSFGGTTDVDPSANTVSYTALGSEDAFVASYFTPAPQIIYVDQNAAGANDGTSWANAHTDIQTALNATAEDDEVWIADGTYAVNNLQVPVASLGIKVFGGFTGSETQKSQRNWTANQTILSGSGSNYQIGLGGFLGYGRATHWDGLYIQNGSGVALGGSATATFTNVWFQDNTNINGGAVGLIGDANDGDAHADFFNCVFYQNTATASGGAVYLGSTSSIGGGGASVMVTATFTNCTFVGNTATGNGGAIATEAGGSDINTATVQVTNSIFWNNTAAAAPSLYHIGNGNASSVSTSTVSYSSFNHPDFTGSASGTQGIAPSVGAGVVMSTDPQLVDEVGGDLRVSNGSSVIDAGSNAALPSDIRDVDDDSSLAETYPFDFGGALRVQAGTVDMGAFEYSAPPTITTFTPTSAASGDTVTITGTDFTGATLVSFGGTAAASFNVVSATSIEAVVDTGTSGNISVTTPGGTATLAGFTFIPAPTITLFTPTSAAIGDTVTITGTDFIGATLVSFGGTPAASFNVVSATSIEAVVDTGTSGSISVTTPGGTATLAGFTFIPAPAITSFTPTSAASGETVTITGTDFTGATLVSFGAIPAASFNVVSATSIEAVVDTGTSGNISVTTPGGTATLAGFTFIPAPSITSFTPTSAASGDTVTITGTDFTGATLISFGGTNAASFNVISATTIEAVVDTGTSGNISVTTPGGTATLAGFTFIPAPAITSFTPTSAAIGDTVTITGTDFTGTTLVSFGAIPAASFNVVSATSIEAIVDTGASGSISVTTPGGTATLAGFTFIPAPTITSFSPTSAASGETVTIIGTDFTGATLVSFGGTAAASFNVVSPTSITAVVNTGTSGNISVTTPGGTATLAGFTFIPAPTIASFTPTSAAIGDTVTIAGTDFTGATLVSFGVTPAASFNVISATSIEAVVDNGTSGNISVTTPGGTATLAGFTFIPAPSITSFTPTSAASGETVTITGTDFTGATLVSFGGTPATSFNVASSTTITAVVDVGTSGSISVTTPGGTAALAGFTFVPAPSITSFTPTSAASGETVTITGTDFTGATLVSFGGTPAASFNVVSATSIEAVVDTGTSGNVSVTTPGGTSSSAGFVFIAVPITLVSDSLALVALYNSTNGPGWTNKTNWLTGSVNTWQGVTVTADRVTDLSLASNNLIGTLPDSLGLLTALQILSLEGNQLSGNITTEIGNLTSLTQLGLSDNFLTGSIPSEIGNLAQLTYFDCSNNQISGSLPASLGNLTLLEWLGVSDNDIGGAIPATFVNLPVIERIFLHGNLFGGALPAFFQNLTSLLTLNISNNNFTELPVLTALPNLTNLRVDDNLFTFEDLEPNASVAGFVYSPQKSTVIGVAVDSLIRANSNYTIQVNENAPSNIYTWTKDGVAQPTLTTGLLSFTPISRETMGQYACTISNSAVPALTFTYSNRVRAFASIEGQVTVSGTAAEKGKVTLLKIVSQAGYDTLFVKPITNQGTFAIDTVLLDDYLLLAEADTLIYSRALPTYFGNTIFWEEADTLQVRAPIQNANVISTLEPLPAQGNGVLFGFVEEDDGTGSRTAGTRRVGGAGVSARRTQGTGRGEEILELTAFTFTDDNGEFRLTNLPTGNYLLNIQYPGYPMDETSFVNFEIGSGPLDQTVQVEATVADNKITVRELIITDLEESDLAIDVFPNPVKEEIHLVSEDVNPTRTLSIYNSAGHRFMSRNIPDQHTTVSVTELPSGVYLVKIVEDQKTKVVRLVIN